MSNDNLNSNHNLIFSFFLTNFINEFSNLNVPNPGMQNSSTALSDILIEMSEKSSIYKESLLKDINQFYSQSFQTYKNIYSSLNKLSTESLTHNITNMIQNLVLGNISRSLIINDNIKVKIYDMLDNFQDKITLFSIFSIICFACGSLASFITIAGYIITDLLDRLNFYFLIKIGWYLILIFIPLSALVSIPSILLSVFYADICGGITLQGIREKNIFTKESEYINIVTYTISNNSDLF